MRFRPETSGSQEIGRPLYVQRDASSDDLAHFYLANRQEEILKQTIVSADKTNRLEDAPKSSRPAKVNGRQNNPD